MTPEEIKRFLADHRRQLHAHPLPTKGKGYSFWLGAPGRVNRIIRASLDSPTSPTKLKLAVTDRLPDRGETSVSEFSFVGGPEELLRYVDLELSLYKTRIQKNALGS